MTNKTFQNLSKAKQERITMAAIAEFSEKGYSGASINALVDQLGIAKGSIFQYFGDKKGLFFFIFDKSTQLVKNKLRTIRDQTQADDLFSRLEKSLLVGIAFLKEHPKIYQIYLHVLFGSNIPFRSEILISLRKYSYEYIRSLLTTAIKKGEIRDDINIEKACFVIDAIMDRFLQTHTIQYMDAGLGIHQADDQVVQAWVKELMEILRIGIGLGPISSMKPSKTNSHEEVKSSQ